MNGTSCTKIVLNIGAGFLPIVASDLKVTQVINYDPLMYSKKTGELKQKDYDDFMTYIKTVLRFKEIMAASKDPDIHYFTDKEEVNEKIGKDSVDLVLSISPYGFSVINEWVDSKLKKMGLLLVIGNMENKWVKNQSNIFSSQDIGKKYSACNDQDVEQWARDIQAMVLEEQLSHTSKIEKGTALNYAMFYQKNDA